MNRVDLMTQKTFDYHLAEMGSKKWTNIRRVTYSADAIELADFYNAQLNNGSIRADPCLSLRFGWAALAGMGGFSPCVGSRRRSVDLAW